MARNKRPLYEIVDEYLATLSEGDLNKYLTRQSAIYYAKTGLRDMSYTVGGTPKSVLMRANSVNFIPWPEDYLVYSKIGYLDAQNVIRVLTRNDKINLRNAASYDSNNNKLLDAEGIDQITVTGQTSKTRLGYDSSSIDYRDVFWNISDGAGHRLGSYLGIAGGQNPKGGYRTSDAGIELSTEFQGDVILEYIGDETMRENPMVLQPLEEPLKSWIYWQSIRQKHNIAAIEKKQAKDNHYAERRVAKHRLRRFTLEELVATSRISSTKLSVKS